MADRSIRGRFVWHDLMTPDTAGAHAFYSKALGWTSETWDKDPSYTMFVGPNGPLGGSVAEPNGTPQWLPYIAVEDAAAAIEEAKALGAEVVKDASPIPNGGTYAVLADPQGAQFGIYSSSSDHGPEKPPKRGEFSWYELATTDAQAALDFYSKLFGWEHITQHDMGPMGIYFIFGRDGAQKGGVYTKPADMKGKPMWVGYVRVKDIEKAVQKVKAARGMLLHGPSEVPGGDWVAQFADPYGAMFALHAAKADVKAPGAAPPREEEETGATAAANEPAAKAPPKKSAKSAAAPAESAAKSTAKPSAKRAKAPAKKSAKAPAKKSAGRKAAGKKAGARKAAKKKAGARKAAKKGAARAAARKKAPAKKRAAARAAKRPARKSAGGARKKAGARRKK